LIRPITVRNCRPNSVGYRLPMDLLTAFGLLAVTAMLVTYALEDRSPWFILAFAGACLLGPAYGFLARCLAVRRFGGALGRRSRFALAKPSLPGEKITLN
jgi:hypothetical protein